LVIGDESKKAIVVAVPQRDAEFYLRQIGASPKVRILGRERTIRHAQLAKVDPRASSVLPHPALASVHGGPLSVVVADDHGATAPDDALRLVEPYFHATITLPADVASQLRAGEIARVRLASTGQSIGRHLGQLVDQWFRRKLLINY
jgi:hypothetical protein